MDDYWYVISLFLVGFNGMIAFMCFRDRRKTVGWINLICSSANLAVLANHFIQI